MANHMMKWYWRQIDDRSTTKEIKFASSLKMAYCSANITQKLIASITTNFLHPKKSVDVLLRNLHEEFGRHPGITQTITAYREKYSNQTLHNYLGKRSCHARNSAQNHQMITNTPAHSCKILANTSQHQNLKYQWLGSATTSVCWLLNYSDCLRCVLEMPICLPYI